MDEEAPQLWSSVEVTYPVIGLSLPRGYSLASAIRECAAVRGNIFKFCGVEQEHKSLRQGKYFAC